MIDTRELARRIRVHSVQMTHDAHSSHVGSCLSCADILATLYNDILKPKQDKFIMSKGHACAALYAILAEKDYFPIEWLKDYCKAGSVLSGHANWEVPGVVVSTGSLGHGLSIACGMVLAGHRTYVLLSDGECNEGSVWESAMFAAHHKLNKLTAIVDCNHQQALGDTNKIISVNLKDMWTATGWSVWNVGGHDVDVLHQFLPTISDKPTCIMAYTVKGKGVSFMENDMAWHYKYCNDEELELAMKELEHVLDYGKHDLAYEE